MGNQKFGVFVGLFGLVALIGLCDSGDVVCSVENYILAGLEFSDCQKEALKSFKADDSKDDGKNPCRILNDVVETCATIVQKCFTDRGWQRGKMVFLDLLALQFPNHNHCNVFLQLNNSASEVPQKLPNERCSIVEEVSLLTEIRLCNNEAQTIVVNRISHHKNSVGQVMTQNSTEFADSVLYYAYPELCKGLQNVTEACFKPKLSQCYDDSDAHFHYSYMLEELKRAGIILALHLLPHAIVGVDILHCPVFLESWSFSSNSSNQTILILSIVLSLVLLLALFTSLSMFAIFKFRLFPRFRAWFQNEPYEDIVINDQNNQREMTNISEDNSQEIRAAAEQQLPSIQELTERGKNPGQTSTVSMANLRHEESAQST